MRSLLVALATPAVMEGDRPSAPVAPLEEAGASESSGVEESHGDDKDSGVGVLGNISNVVAARVHEMEKRVAAVLRDESVRMRKAVLKDAKAPRGEKARDVCARKMRRVHLAAHRDGWRWLRCPPAINTLFISFFCSSVAAVVDHLSLDILLRPLYDKTVLL